MSALLICIRRGTRGIGACANLQSLRLYSTDTSHALPLNVPVYGVWGANTSVGKTLVSSGLALAASEACHKGSVSYIKPIQTGFPADSDGGLVATVCSSTATFGPHAAHLLQQKPPTTSDFIARYGIQSQGIYASTLFAWQEAVGPHVAMEREGRPVTDDEVVSSVMQTLDHHSHHVQAEGLGPGFSLVETAGGVCSPSASGRLQVDVWQGMRMPAILVGDGRLGGISATLSAYDSLIMRGYDVAAVVVLEDSSLGNSVSLERHLRGGPGGVTPPVYTLPFCPPPAPTSDGPSVGQIDDSLRQWLEGNKSTFSDLHAHLTNAHTARVEWLQSAPEKALKSIWWPFTQHRNISADKVTVIDGRYGENFLVATPEKGGGANGTKSPARVERMYDACASWWTQGMNEEVQPLVTRSLAYAAGRFSHVIFPENVHRPALELTEKLLDGPGAGWASRAFYTDDGSTAVEVALKMAFRKHSVDRAKQGLSEDADRPKHVLALLNGYHGDTLGAMACSEESVFNAGQTPWYRANGLFMDAPTCGLSKGVWEVRPPGIAVCPAAVTLKFGTFSDLFAAERDTSKEAEHYENVVKDAIDSHEGASGALVSACLMEPLLQGAGGMLFIDPLFQRMIIKVCKDRQIPVIADEVFTGLWRLGRVSAMSMLNRQPDIACYAKLLTAGTVPMSVTLASEDVFAAFDGDTKAEALLHGHSYTAHPVGCQVGVASLNILGNSEFNQNIRPAEAKDAITPTTKLCDLWNADAVTDLSHHDAVERIVLLGTVLAVELKVAPGNGGYSSNVARGVTDKMRKMGVYARPLGNVVYLMCTPTSKPESLTQLLSVLTQCIDAN